MTIDKDSLVEDVKSSLKSFATANASTILAMTLDQLTELKALLADGKTDEALRVLFAAMSSEDLAAARDAETVLQKQFINENYERGQKLRDLQNNFIAAVISLAIEAIEGSL